jgi:hypothetical protein
MASNTAIDISDLDFDQIKTKLKTYLQSQETFTDYDFEGSALSTLLNILSYNTHYNAYYLNMVANEMFLDTAVKRSSVVSHAKLLNYTPISTQSAKAAVNLTFYTVGTTSLTIPKHTIFSSETIDDINYYFVSSEEYTASRNESNQTVTFNGVELIQGQKLNYNYTVNKTSNPTLTFKLPDPTIDTSTLIVTVRTNINSTDFVTFNRADSILKLTEASNVYFLQESLDGYYEIYFGDGILGKTLDNGNIVSVTYISSKGSLPNGAQKFTLMESIGSYSSVIITTSTVAAGGGEKESISSIKYNAPKRYSSSGRAVTKADYINILTNSNSVIPIEAINVWGGDEETHKRIGKIFIAIKPVGGYVITDSQKTKLLQEVIKPISVVTVEPEIVDVDYTYVYVSAVILFNYSQSLISTDVLKTYARQAIIDFCDKTLNKFNSNFVLPDLTYAVKNTDNSIISVDAKISLTKKANPILNAFNNLTFDFGVALKNDSIYGPITTSTFSTILSDNSTIATGVKIEGVPLILNVVESITVKQSGSGYTSTPTVQIVGDGTGATATASIVNGKVQEIIVTNSGSGYTQAIAKIVGGGGKGATAIANLTGNTIKLRSYYYVNGVKTILDSDVGLLNFTTGVITLDNFLPLEVEDPLGSFTVSVVPDTTIISSGKSSIITLDPLDQAAISLSVQQL